MSNLVGSKSWVKDVILVFKYIIDKSVCVCAEIVDGNVKMTLGMIWTIILRFAIQDISVEGVFV